LFPSQQLHSKLIPLFIRRGISRLQPTFPAVTVTLLLALLPWNTCLFRRFLGIPCPGCGFTRSVLALAHGQFTHSFFFHPAIIPGVLLAIATLVLALVLPDNDPRWDRFTRFALNSFGVVLVLVWSLRLLHVLPEV